MATVSQVAVEYAARGARATQRADRKVRESIQETADTARRESGTINRWMQRHQTALQGIAVATAGVLASIISASPTARAELDGVRMAFSLLADTIVRDVLPEGGSLTELAIDIADAYEDLPDPIRETASAAILLGGGALAGAAGLGALTQLVFGTSLAGAISGIGGAAVGTAGALIGIAVAAGVAGSELLGVTDVTPIAAAEMDTVQGAAADLGFFLGGPFVGLVLTGLAALEGGWDNAKRVAGRSMEEWLKASARFANRVQTGFLALGQGLRGSAELTWDYIVNAAKRGMNGMVSWIEDGTNRAIDALNRIPEVDLDPVQIERFDVASDEQLVRDARRRTRRRLEDLAQRRRRVMEQFAPESIQIAPEDDPSGSGTQSGAGRGPSRRPPPSGTPSTRSSGSDRPVNVTIERGAIQYRGQQGRRADGDRIDDREVAESVGREFGRRFGGSGVGQ